MNVPIHGPADPALVSSHAGVVQSAATVPAATYILVRQSVERAIESRYRNERAFEVFKGKWFAVLLAEELSLHIPTQWRRVKAFPERIVGHTAQTLDPSGGWSNFLREGVEGGGSCARRGLMLLT